MQLWYLWKVYRFNDVAMFEFAKFFPCGGTPKLCGEIPWCCSCECSCKCIDFDGPNCTFVPVKWSYPIPGLSISDLRDFVCVRFPSRRENKSDKRRVGYGENCWWDYLPCAELTRSVFFSISWFPLASLSTTNWISVSGLLWPRDTIWLMMQWAVVLRS